MRGTEKGRWGGRMKVIPSFRWLRTLQQYFHITAQSSPQYSIVKLAPTSTWHDKICSRSDATSCTPPL
uniref:Uncharacterized protein n=1 Tax=Parascaris univalens TaxID=6257 RepID=A0A915B5R9_PARUN